MKKINRLIKTKTDALIAQLCEDYPKLSDSQLSEMIGKKVVKPKYFIFESKINYETSKEKTD